MCRHARGLLAVLILCIVLLPGHAMGENKPGIIGITLFGGGYAFESDQDLDTTGALGFGIAYNISVNWGMEAMITYVSTQDDQDEDASVYVYQLDQVYHFTPEKKLVPYVAAGIGAISLDYDNALRSNETDSLVNYGGGVKYFIDEFTVLRADARHIISFNDTNHNLRYTLGLLFCFGGEKAGADRDADGVADEYDKCPNTPHGVSVDGSGCPKDSDKDFVYDYLDQCPETPAGVTVDERGCPVDSDGDGLPDYQDKCPNTPSGVAVDDSGCARDSDGDGVYDYVDMCENTPPGVPVDEKGCPSAAPKGAELTEHGTYVFRNIQFESGSATLKQDSYPAMDEVVKFLEDNPDLKIEIQGHTDNVGPLDLNLRLSGSRAMAVMEYLISKDIAPERLTAKGYGMSDPMMSNDTPEGRALNRRVEFAPVP